MGCFKSGGNGLFRCVVLLMLLGLQSAWAEGVGRMPGQSSEAEGYADGASCLGCHATEAGQWKDSDHGWAMRKAEAGNVLGNFDAATFDEAGVKARFFRKGDDYFVNTEGEDGKVADFQVLYTFGFSPLQQYLVALPRGRLQALTIAWDSRSKAEGGQRWFSLYPGQRFAPNDPLHWTGRYQNWNSMCADCHSTRLMKHYDDKQDSFSSTWHEQTVGCQGCHGPGQAHVDWAKQNKSANKTYAAAADLGLKVDFKALGSKGLVEQCAYCHSRRQSLGTGQEPGQPQLDQSLPATLRAGLYHADGQIDGEVYEHGSFTQSKMYAAGVACTDCHNPHTTQVRIKGNGLCLQCHNTNLPLARFASLQAKDYDSKAHHHHEPGTPGAQCVNCHMPSKTYMVVDPRRDHSLRIPRPDLAAKSGSPDACTSCHQDQKPAWAATAIEGWYGKANRPPHYGEDFHAVRSGQGISLSLLGSVLADKGKPAIVRATAAEQMADLGPPAISNLQWALKDDSALVRAYAVSGFASVPPAERLKPLLPLLEDPTRAVRDETVRALVDIPPEQLPAERREPFRSLLADYERRLRGNADLPGGRLNLAVMLSRQGRDGEAMEQYRQALKLDPYFSPARVNLVTLASSSQRLDEAEQLLREGLALEKMPETDHGNLAYMLSLLLVERGRADEALNWMEKAAVELPGNSRIRYNQGLLLSRMNRRGDALSALRSGLEQSPADADLLYSLIYLHAVEGERNEAFEYVKRMREVAPDDPRLQAIEPYWKQ
ncbi:tetratricopeptide repeat protein [Pseudomonas sp. BN414]|uniref:tetratricopeptide repeat protein n=1 Tax=Pseudomonas sp. BN414 TaxID=2567888 RepID=UPI002458B35D|nr:tetratricopeptide repeat protein [Pseudomonas sp. BN414]MDH4566992.1 tetratricopeptide repeat protein [Pseudomonas sp. BN414]